MAHRTFFSFHYERDVGGLRSYGTALNSTHPREPGSSHRSWEATKPQGPTAIKRLIDSALERTSVTAVHIGAQRHLLDDGLRTRSTQVSPEVMAYPASIYTTSEIKTGNVDSKGHNPCRLGAAYTAGSTTPVTST